VLLNENGTAVKGTVLVLHHFGKKHDGKREVADSPSRSGPVQEVPSAACRALGNSMSSPSKPMHLSIRIKASEDPNDLKALAESGGQYLDLRYPKFAFPSEAHQMKYNRIRKELRGGEGSSES